MHLKQKVFIRFVTLAGHRHHNREKVSSRRLQVQKRNRVVPNIKGRYFLLFRETPNQINKHSKITLHFTILRQFIYDQSYTAFHHEFMRFLSSCAQSIVCLVNYVSISNIYTQFSFFKSQFFMILYFVGARIISLWMVLVTMAGRIKDGRLRPVMVKPCLHRFRNLFATCFATDFFATDWRSMRLVQPLYAHIRIEIIVAD